jgi:enamine deaminase RidA (YjgF/YER057c/UK114 family)
MNRVTKSLAVLAALLLASNAADAQQQRVEGVHASIGYADAIQVGNTVYVSGVVARGANMEEQVTSIYAQLTAVLAKFGASMGDVVKETVFTTNMDALIAANPARLRAYGKHAPAATWVQIQRLYMTSALLEIEVIAVPGSGK